MKKLLLIFSVLVSAHFAFAQCSSCTIPFVSSSQGIGSSTAVTIPLPLGVSVNDVMIVAVHSGWCSQGSSVTPPQGWTPIAQTSNTGSGCGPINSSVQLSTFYKIATANEPSAYIFTGTTSQTYVGSIVVYSGVDLLNPVHAFSNNGAQDSCSVIRASSVNTTVCTRLVGVFFCSVNSSATNLVPDVLLTERADVGTTGNNPWGNENLMMADRLLTTTGATGDFVSSLWGCSGDGWITGAQLIALTCDLSLGTNLAVTSETFSIQPNPSDAVFQISMAQPGTGSYMVTNALGQVVRAGQITGTVWPVDLSGEAAGVYFIQVNTLQGVTTKKLVLR
ncbi:MAG: T9SS type A sorting domain-containing protein [Bacteroidia bacterium]|nr:T9SS type A sorting domain-containing protein [Bacteroidia bacterium]